MRGYGPCVEAGCFCPNVERVTMNVQSSGCCRWPWLATGRLGRFAAAAVVGLGAWGWLSWSASSALLVHAGEGAGVDSDGDGLHDELEVVMGTNPSRFDTDGDGYGDGEEVARGSNARRKQLVPEEGGGPGVSMDAYSRSGKVHALTTIYLPPGLQRTRSFRFGIELNDRLINLPLATLRGGEAPRVLGLPGGGKLVVFDPIVPQSFALARGGLAMFVTVSNNGSYVAAGSMSLAVADGELFERVEVDLSQLAASSLQAGSAQPGATQGGVFRPLTAGGGSSASQSAGRICAQSTMILGVVGALVTQEVVDAGCVDGWDAHCTPGCAATIGMTVKSIDPAALIGG